MELKEKLEYVENLVRLENELIKQRWELEKGDAYTHLSLCNGHVAEFIINMTDDKFSKKIIKLLLDKVNKDMKFVQDKLDAVNIDI